jgi:hypothetical protein
MFPLLALALGHAVAAGVGRIRAARPIGERAIGAAAIAGALLGPSLFQGALTGLISSTRAEQHQSYEQSYGWKDAPLIGPLNGLVRALFFEDGVRVPGSWHLGVTEYLWNQSRGFDSYPAIVDEVQRDAPARATVFGDSSTLPLVALGAGRRIALDFADTNVQRFTTGTTTPEDAIAALERDPPTVVVSAGGGFYGLPQFKQWVQAHYSEVRSFTDGDGTRYSVHVRR